MTDLGFAKVKKMRYTEYDLRQVMEKSPVELILPEMVRTEDTCNNRRDRTVKLPVPITKIYNFKVQCYFASFLILSNSLSMTSS